MSAIEINTLPKELADVQAEIEEYAREYGLDFFPTIFELVEPDRLNAIAAKGGFPTRYPHWRFGMEYDQLSKGYHFGLQKIYEMVINNNPCYAYLMTVNDRMDQKLVMAHVYGHCDFFKNNEWFSKTNRKMMDEMANHGNRIRQYMDDVGVEEVEEFIDACLSIDNLIDIHAPFIKRKELTNKYDFDPQKKKPPSRGPGRFKAKSYMDPFVNPRELLKAEGERMKKNEMAPKRIPEHPERDVMQFVLEYAPLNGWQADILAILRDEAYYFAPQAQTKIMNEGWASYWHSTIMTQKGLEAKDVIDYCSHHSGTLASTPTQLNPYKLGIELFRHIEDRWNRGQFGKEWDECDDYQTRGQWDTGAGLGREKIFEVRKVHNDLTFMDAFLTLEFVRENRLFQFGFNQSTEYYEIESREFPKVKRQLLANLTNAGRPQIAVRDGNYRNRGELYLEHLYTGVELQMDYARDTLVNLQKLWDRPVHLETVFRDGMMVLSFDGKEHSIESAGASSEDTEELIL